VCVGRGAEGEGERKNLKQAPCSVEPDVGLQVGLNVGAHPHDPEIMTGAKIKNLNLNQ